MKYHRIKKLLDKSRTRNYVYGNVWLEKKNK